MKIALRIDVDTLRGTKYGVPNLLLLLDKYNIKGAFFFSVGPDNMGRHIWRLLKPSFLWKMLRTNAMSLYGPGVILNGTFWPGKNIGEHCKEIIINCNDKGHEIGLHAWDHHQWQSKIELMDYDNIHRIFDKSYKCLESIIGRAPDCSAVPAWKCTDNVLNIKDKYNFIYNSDCRGSFPFFTVTLGSILKTPQIPVNLPTFDELIGKNGITPQNFNKELFKLIDNNSYNLLTIHAEVEGGKFQNLFEEFILEALDKGYEFVKPSDLLPKDNLELESKKIIKSRIKGRQGWISVKE